MDAVTNVPLPANETVMLYIPASSLTLLSSATS